MEREKKEQQIVASFLCVWPAILSLSMTFQLFNFSQKSILCVLPLSLPAIQDIHFELNRIWLLFGVRCFIVCSIEAACASIAAQCFHKQVKTNGIKFDSSPRLIGIVRQYCLNKMYNDLVWAIAIRRKNIKANEKIALALNNNSNNKNISTIHKYTKLRTNKQIEWLCYIKSIESWMGLHAQWNANRMTGWWGMNKLLNMMDSWFSFNEHLPTISESGLLYDSLNGLFSSGNGDSTIIFFRAANRSSFDVCVRLFPFLVYTWTEQRRERNKKQNSLTFKLPKAMIAFLISWSVRLGSTH